MFAAKCQAVSGAHSHACHMAASEELNTELQAAARMMMHTTTACSVPLVSSLGPHPSPPATAYLSSPSRHTFCSSSPSTHYRAPCFSPAGITPYRSPTHTSLPAFAPLHPLPLVSFPLTSALFKRPGQKLSRGRVPLFLSYSLATRLLALLLPSCKQRGVVRALFSPSGVLYDPLVHECARCCSFFP